MFCSNCGNRLKTKEQFCSKCGIKIQNNNSNTTADIISKKISKIFSCFTNSIKTFITKYKKQLMIISSCCLLFIIAISLFNKFYDSSKIVWNDKLSSDANLIESTTLTYKVDKIIEKDGNDKITWKVTGGEIIVNGSDDSSAEWILPEKSGKYEISAQFRNKEIKKTVTVLESNVSTGISFEKEDLNGDEDGDGITNKDEQTYGTNIYDIDTDRDGLSDYYEINISKTDPLKYDSDDDKLSDGDELVFELNPNNKHSKEYNILDGEINLDYTIKEDEISLSVKGTGDLATTTIDILNDDSLNSIEGIISNLYLLSSKGNVSESNLVINYDENIINEKGYDENNINIYSLDIINKKFSKLDSEVNVEENKIETTINMMGTFLIADSSTLKETIQSEIMFVIDNSVSMYNENQMKNAGYTESTGAIGNDTEFKRLSLTNKLIDMLSGNYKFGVSEFSGNYVNLINFTDSKSKVKEKVNSMKNHWESNLNGTNIISALKNGIAEFSLNDNKHYLLLLTDGKNTEGFLSFNKSAIINSAKEKNVQIYVIGLGSEIDTTDLSDIASKTGGKYYHASSSNLLDSVYNDLMQDINYNLIDTDDDNQTDSIVIADSGFRPNKNGLSFSNFGTNIASSGNCAGIVAFSQLYYLNKLPLSGSDFEVSIEGNNTKISGYNLNNFNQIKNGTALYDIKMNDLKLFTDEKSEYTKKIKKDGINYYLESNKNYLKNIGYDFYIDNKTEQAILNVDSDNFKNNLNSDEREFIRALGYYWAKQFSYKKIGVIHYDNSMTTLIDKVSSGIPIYSAFKVDKVLGPAGLGAGHAVNIYKISQDVNNPNSIKFFTYDNNYSGKERYMYVERTKLKMLDPIISNSKYSYHVTYEWTKGKNNTSSIFIYDIMN